MSNVDDDASETDAGSRGRGGITGKLASVDSRWYVLVFYAFLLAWLVYLLVLAWGWRWADKLLPYLAGVPTVALIVLKMVELAFPEQFDRLRPSTESSGDQEADTDGERADLEESLQEARSGSENVRPRTDRIRYGLVMLGWALALPTLMYFIGFTNALPLFLFVFGLQFYDSVLEAIGITVVSFGLIYAFFYVVIGMQPWDGTLGLPSFLSLLGIG